MKHFLRISGAMVRTGGLAWIRRIVPPLLTIMAIAGTVCLSAQPNQPRTPEAALADPQVQRELKQIESEKVQMADFLAHLGAIPSPSGGERDRALAVKAKMEEIGLKRVSIGDGSSPNVVGVIPGRSGRSLVFIAILDDLKRTVNAQKEAKHPPLVTGDRVVGPGVDHPSSVAAILAAAKALLNAGFVPEHDLVFAAVAQEEHGLVGMKRLYADYKQSAISFIDVLGDGSKKIWFGAMGRHQWKITATGPGGHSLDGGLPNINLSISRAVDQIFQLPQPRQYKALHTIINVAVIQSGVDANHKPETGWFTLDVRSLDNSVIEKIEHDVRSILDRVATQTTMGQKPPIHFTMELEVTTPGGQIPDARQSVLVRTANDIVAQYLHLQPTLDNAGSSNMNVAIAGGTPAIALWGERGDAALIGTLEEFADIPALVRSAKVVLLLAVTMGG